MEAPARVGTIGRIDAHGLICTSICTCLRQGREVKEPAILTQWEMYSVPAWGRCFFLAPEIDPGGGAILQRGKLELLVYFWV